MTVSICASSVFVRMYVLSNQSHVVDKVLLNARQTPIHHISVVHMMV